MKLKCPNCNLETKPPFGYDDYAGDCLKCPKCQTELRLQSPDILFKCGSCGKHLVIDGAGGGMQVNCPDCSSSVIAPKATAVHTCSHCGKEVQIDTAMVGEFHCPDCKKLILLRLAPSKMWAFLTKPREDLYPSWWKKQLYPWFCERWWGNLMFAGLWLAFGILLFFGTKSSVSYYQGRDGLGGSFYTSFACMLYQKYGNWGLVLIGALFASPGIRYVITAGFQLRSVYSEAAKHPENKVGMIVLGYFLALLFPIIGFVFGLYLLFSRNRVGHFFGLFVLSLFSLAFWAVLWAELQPQPVQYWWVAWWYEIRWW